MLETLVYRVLLLGAALITYGVVIIFAGHGAGPVAALMVLGSPSAWGSSQFPGWLGVLVSLAAVFARSDAAYLATRFWGVVLLALSLGAFVSNGEAILISALTALPFLGLGGFFLSSYLVSWRREPGRSDRPRQITWAVAALVASLVIEAAFLLPTFAAQRLVAEQITEALQFLALIVMAVHIWKGRNWARWAVVILIVATRIYYARSTLYALQQGTLLALVSGIMLLLDLAILTLLLSPTASSWLRHPTHPPDGVRMAAH